VSFNAALNALIRAAGLARAEPSPDRQAEAVR